ncbi:hypothetical protein [Acidaminococcus sp. BV3L6]|uniref:hypothetical protein n=1 Tax=Acidaminococcus sp. (strain BV3L6) TaxID=1111120 RepID=UPI001E4CAD50|nr:hypothetical protein [Acidaminococcus sp. BV3L6]
MEVLLSIFPIFAIIGIGCMLQGAHWFSPPLFVGAFKADHEDCPARIHLYLRHPYA